MATAARYWRIGFRSTFASNYAQYSYSFGSLRFMSSSDVDLSSGLLAAAITTTAPLLNSTSYPLINVVDANTSTFCAINYTGGTLNQSQTWYYIQFDFGTAVLPDYISIFMSGTAPSGNLLDPTLFEFYIDSSLDNVTYIRQAMHYRPVSVTNTVLRMAATANSSIWPMPPREPLGGSGGIYGIVSEDGVALPNRPVILLERDTFYKVGYTTTDENGGYAFNGLNEAREYTVMSVDPSGPPYKNALIWDRITPINTKGALTPQSAFWARRFREPTLGPLISISNYLDGAVYNFVKQSIGGHNYLNRNRVPDGHSLWPATAVGGSLNFLKSSRTSTNTGEGIQFVGGAGLFNGVNAAGAANVTNLTFEYVVQTPGLSESQLFITWSGTRDSDDALMTDTDTFLWGQSAIGRGPTLQITNAGVINVRFPLSGLNLATVRATATVTPGSICHIMVTYVQDTEIKLYVNGSLIQTTAISGGGRIWGWLFANSSPTFPAAAENWDYLAHPYLGNAAIRRFSSVCFYGPGSTINSSTTMYNTGPGFGGGVAFVALYGRAFSASDVATFYDSYANWETHTVLSTQSGYMGEIETDNPKFYIRMDNLVAPTRYSSLVGNEDYATASEGSPLFGQTGFVSGSTSINTSSGGILVSAMNLANVFTVEFFCRLTSITGTQYFFAQRIYNSSAPIYLGIVSGVLSLYITDSSGTVATIPLGQTLAISTNYHIAVSYDPWDTKLCKCYINGVLVSSQTASVIPQANADWIGIGTNPSGTGPSYANRVQGTMGEFAMYNYVVPAARILAHYEARNA